jgi:hypothetical protein
MAVALKMFDRPLGGKQMLARELRVVSDRMTVQELIERRVDAEIAELEGKAASEISHHNSLLVIPSFVETILNGRKTYGEARALKSHKIDRQAQIDVVTIAFRSNQLLMLVDNQQVTSLDQFVAFTENSSITFIKLVPLVGG